MEDPKPATAPASPPPAGIAPPAQRRVRRHAFVLRAGFLCALIGTIGLLAGWVLSTHVPRFTGLASFLLVLLGASLTSVAKTIAPANAQTKTPSPGRALLCIGCLAMASVASLILFLLFSAGLVLSIAGRIRAGPVLGSVLFGSLAAFALTQAIVFCILAWRAHRRRREIMAGAPGAAPASTTAER